jgi:glutathione S-transferase
MRAGHVGLLQLVVPDRVRGHAAVVTQTKEFFVSQTTALYRIVGAEMSPYSVKVRSYFRFKGLDHEWFPHDPAVADLYKQHAKIPIIPLVVTPDGRGLQDSTPIIEGLEGSVDGQSGPSIVPDCPVLAFLSHLLEEYGDEWGNKWMFHYRWCRDVDQVSSAQRLAAMSLGLESDPSATVDAATLQGTADFIRDRMKNRVWFVGSSDQTKERIEGSFRNVAAILNRHLSSRAYLFGGSPVLADFGLGAQMYECLTDPTTGGILREEAPSVVAWVERFLNPTVEGPLESWEQLAPTLMPLLCDDLAAFFLPWSTANAEAMAAGAEEFTVRLGDQDWTQKPQRYHAKSLAALRQRYAGVADVAELNAVLADSGCLPFLK